MYKQKYSNMMRIKRYDLMSNLEYITKNSVYQSNGVVGQNKIDLAST